MCAGSLVNADICSCNYAPHKLLLHIAQKRCCSMDVRLHENCHAQLFFSAEQIRQIESAQFAIVHQLGSEVMHTLKTPGL